MTVCDATGPKPTGALGHFLGLVGVGRGWEGLLNQA